MVPGLRAVQREIKPLAVPMPQGVFLFCRKISPDPPTRAEGESCPWPWPHQPPPIFLATNHPPPPPQALLNLTHAL